MPVIIEGLVVVLFIWLFVLFLMKGTRRVIKGNQSKEASSQMDLEKQLVAGLALEDIPEGEAEFKARIGVFTKREGDKVTYEILLINNSTRRV